MKFKSILSFGLAIGLSVFISANAKAIEYPAALFPIKGYEVTTDNTTLAQGLLDQLIVKYNQRFDSQGNLIPNESTTKAFIELQNETIESLKEKGTYIFQFRVTNNLSPAANADSYLLVDESKELLAMSFEAASTQNGLDQSVLRLRPVKYFKQLQTVQELDGQPALVVASSVTDWKNGGEIQIYCLTDKKKKKYSAIKFKLLKNEKNQWGVFYQNKFISKMYLKIWINVFSANGGISEVTVNDSVKVVLEPVIGLQLKKLRNFAQTYELSK